MAPIVAAVIWVFAATATALLPMRRQMLPGLALLVSAPAVILWLGWVHGWPFALAGFLAFVSMFRRPLAYLIRRLAGAPAERSDRGEGME